MILNHIQSNLFFFDGAMGTMLQSYDACKGLSSEDCNLKAPLAVTAVHQAYLEAGSHVISANTFGVSKQSVLNEAYPVDDVVTGAMNAAKEALKAYPERYVAYDMGPTGILLAPTGDLRFDDAYACFKTQAQLAESHGAHLIIIETMTDIAEARIALLACKENCSLPVIVSLSFQEDGRTLNGTSPEAMSRILSSLGADAIGINCSIGPEEIYPLAAKLRTHSALPILIQANAGMPTLSLGKTIFPSVPTAYAPDMKRLLELGVTGFGGCCGTTPEHIQTLIAHVTERALTLDASALPFYEDVPVICSPMNAVVLQNRIFVTGERLNPMGNKPLRAALKEGEYDEAYKQALLQERAGADLLDFNCAIAKMDENDMFARLLPNIASLISIPLQFDSSNPQVFEPLLRQYAGKALLNSANGKTDSMHTVFPLAKKYGALVVCLLLDDKGLPQSAAERIAIFETMRETAHAYGLRDHDLVVDCLTLTAAAQQNQVGETLAALEYVKKNSGCLTTLGVSNISFGLPERSTLNRAFLAAALERGLDLPIIDPLDQGMMDVVTGFNVLKGYDLGCTTYIEKLANRPTQEARATATPTAQSNGTQTGSSTAQNNGTHTVSPTEPPTNESALLQDAILNGYADTAGKLTDGLLNTLEPLELIQTIVVPALQQIGERFETGKVYLPQLIRAAEAAGFVFDAVRRRFPERDEEAGQKIILATVYGDIHDIGKNLVKVLLKNHGFKVIDLGKDVHPDLVLEAVKAHDCKLVGLSALMTTTLPSMEATITLLKEYDPSIRVIVGGAVLTQEYADLIAADHYCKDALATVHKTQAYYE